MLTKKVFALLVGCGLSFETANSTTEWNWEPEEAMTCGDIRPVEQGLSEISVKSGSDDESVVEEHREEEEGRCNIIMGARGLLGIHVPGLKAEFRGGYAIICAETGVFFKHAGTSRLKGPLGKGQLWFYGLYHKCAKKIAIPASELPDDLVFSEEGDAVVVEISDPLEIITLCFAFMTLKEMGLTGKALDRDFLDRMQEDTICGFFNDNLIEHGISDPSKIDSLRRVTKGCTLARIQSFPKGEGLTTTLGCKTIFCRAEQYIWVKNVLIDINKTFSVL